MKRKIVLKVDVCDDRSKSKALKITATRVPGVDSITMDMESKKMTVVGDDLDPILLATVLRKHWVTELLSVGPVRKQEDDNYDKEEDGGGGGSSGGRGGSGRGDGGDSDGGDNDDDDHQDPCNQSGGQNGSLLFNLTDYNNWRRNARRVKILALCFFFFEVQRFVLLLRGSTKVFRFPSGEPSERFHRTIADETPKY